MEEAKTSRGRGHPRQGTVVNIRVKDEDLEEAKVIAVDEKRKVAEVLRELIHIGLAARRAISQEKSRK